MSATGRERPTGGLSPPAGEVVVLAAIDDSAAARPVLVAALRLAELTGASVAALHVREDGAGATARAAAASAEVALEEQRGDPVDRIAGAAAADAVQAVAVGTRATPVGAGRIGHVALDLVCRLDKPVLAVPPVFDDGPIRRILVPHDGAAATTDALRDLLRSLGDAPAAPAVVVLHVFEPDALPLFADHQAHEAETWNRAFLERVYPRPVSDVSVETRVGAAEEQVRAAGEEVGAGVVAVGWRRDLSPGRARIVRALLERCALPVLLLPVAAPAVGAGQQAGATSGWSAR